MWLCIVYVLYHRKLSFSFSIILCIYVCIFTINHIAMVWVSGRMKCEEHLLSLFCTHVFKREVKFDIMPEKYSIGICVFVYTVSWYLCIIVYINTNHNKFTWKFYYTPIPLHTYINNPLLDTPPHTGILKNHLPQ